MTAIERDLLAWTKAKLRFAAWALGPGFSGIRASRDKSRDEMIAADTVLMRQGMKLIHRKAKEKKKR